MKGVRLQEMIERCELSDVSHEGIVVSGPGYTNYNRHVKTTVYYILMDVKAAFMLTSCRTHTMADLNTSDNLCL